MKRIAQRGMTLTETLVVSSLVAIVASVVGLYGLGLVRSERQRGAVYELFIQISQARAEAVHRNRSCRLLIDAVARTVSVVDLNDPASDGDDDEISRVTMGSGVDFRLPDGSTPITLDALPGSRFEAVFARDGTLASSVGSVGLQSGDRFHRVSVYAGGGIAVERWNGSAWVNEA